MHSVDLASAVSNASADSALVCNCFNSSVSLFVIEILATGSASVAVSLPPLPPPEEVLGGSRQGEAGGQSAGIPGGSRQGEDEGLKPCSDKKSFVSLLYQHAYQLEQISSNEVEHCKRIAVQVQDVPLNSCARALIRKENHSYFRNSEATRRFSGVNTWMAVDTVQKKACRTVQFPHGMRCTLKCQHPGTSPLWTMSQPCEQQQALHQQHSGGLTTVCVHCL